MVKYKNILVAIDFSEGSDLIVKKAAELAKQMGAKLNLLHVVEPLPGYGYAFIGSAEVENELVEEAKRQMVKMGGKYSVAIEDQHVEIGPPKVEIAQLAEEHKIDLIVIGSHGHHGFVEYLLGSTANAVIHRAKCDVLTVRIK